MTASIQDKIKAHNKVCELWHLQEDSSWARKWAVMMTLYSSFSFLFLFIIHDLFYIILVFIHCSLALQCSSSTIVSIETMLFMVVISMVTSQSLYWLFIIFWMLILSVFSVKIYKKNSKQKTALFFYFVKLQTVFFISITNLRQLCNTQSGQFIYVFTKYGVDLL